MSNPARYWRAEEEAVIRRLYPEARWAEIEAELPGRTRESIAFRAYKLGVKRTKRDHSERKKRGRPDGAAFLTGTAVVEAGSKPDVTAALVARSLGGGKFETVKVFSNPTAPTPGVSMHEFANRVKEESDRAARRSRETAEAISAKLSGAIRYDKVKPGMRINVIPHGTTAKPRYRTVSRVEVKKVTHKVLFGLEWIAEPTESGKIEFPAEWWDLAAFPQLSFEVEP